MSLLRNLSPDIGYPAKEAGVQMARNLTLSEQLKEKIQYHQGQLDKIKATLQLLETNQDFEKLLYLLNEVH